MRSFIFALQYGEFIRSVLYVYGRIQDDHVALEPKFLTELSACRSIMRPRFLHIRRLGPSEQWRPDGLSSIEFIRWYTRVTPNSAGAINYQRTSISVFPPFLSIATVFSRIRCANISGRNCFRRNDTARGEKEILNRQLKSGGNFKLRY